jgi:poly(A) polymerase
MFDFTSAFALQSLQVIEKLQQAGFVAYLAGGCVRDALLGRNPKDFDVATDATPDAVRSLFGRRRTLAFGASFGVIGVLGTASVPTEVATFRSDGEYSDGRRPDSVKFGDAKHDAMRRDFTINGMFYDPVAAKLIDFVGGEADLANAVVRAIGDPEKRIQEDKLRMLRAVRFAASLGFRIESQTFDAILRRSPEVTVVSGERIGAELRRMWSGRGAAEAFEMLHSVRLLSQIWPRAASALNEQPELKSDALKLLPIASKRSFEASVASLMAILQIASEAALNEITDAWKLSCDEQRAIAAATLHRETIISADALPWSVTQPILASRDASTIIAVADAWVTALDLSRQGVDLASTCLEWPRERLDPPPLLTGDTLRELGFKPGRYFGPVLQTIRSEQLDQRLTNTAEAIERAKVLIAQSS